MRYFYVETVLMRYPSSHTLLFGFITYFFGFRLRFIYRCDFTIRFRRSVGPSISMWVIWYLRRANFNFHLPDWLALRLISVSSSIPFSILDLVPFACSALYKFYCAANHFLNIYIYMLAARACLELENQMRMRDR